MKNFLKPLKFNTPEDNIFFWGCLHLNHDPKWDIPLWKRRGFNNVQDHNDYIKTTWQQTLNQDSIIFLLGDTCFGHKANETIISLLESVPFKECYLLPGNHTAGWKQLLDITDENGLINIQAKKIYLTPNYLEIIVNGHAAVLSHYPIVSWNGQSKGSYMVHAHVHGSLEESNIGKLLYLSRIKEVSLEKCLIPLSFNKLKKSFNQSVLK